MTAKAIRSLSDKKYRENTKKFLVEGEKNVLELIKSDLQIDSVFATKEFQKKVDEYYRKKYTKELLNTKNKDYIKRNKVNTDFLKNPDYEFATIENLYDGIINNPKKIRQTNFE